MAGKSKDPEQILMDSATPAPAPRAPAAQDEPLTHDEKVERFEEKLGELRATTYPVLEPVTRTAEEKVAAVNRRLAGMSG